MGPWNRNSLRIVQLEIYDPDFMKQKGIYQSNLSHTGKIGRWRFGFGRWQRGRTHTAAAPLVGGTRQSFFLRGQWSARNSPRGTTVVVVTERRCVTVAGYIPHSRTVSGGSMRSLLTKRP
jgi:hypothetical protein